VCVYVSAEGIDLTIYLSTCPPPICLSYLPNHLSTNQINQLTYLLTSLFTYDLAKTLHELLGSHPLHKKLILYGHSILRITPRLLPANCLLVLAKTTPIRRTQQLPRPTATYQDTRACSVWGCGAGCTQTCTTACGQMIWNLQRLLLAQEHPKEVEDPKVVLDDRI
jgi:hypothetical protein